MLMTNIEKANFLIEKWNQNTDNEYIFKTSGSTGIPKEITFSKEKVKLSAQNTINFLGLNTTDKALINLNIDFIAGAMMLIRCLEANMNFRVIEPSGNPFENINIGEEFSFYSFVPQQLSNIIVNKSNIEKLNKAKAIIVGGAAMSDELIANCQNIKSPIYSTYGMTETISHIALKQINGTNKSDCFELLNGFEIDTDERDCLCIKSFITDNKWITTNDIVTIDENKKTFKFLGRYDDVINSGGIKIFPNEIENLISKYFSENKIQFNYFVSSLQDEYFGETVCLFIESKIQDKDLKNKLFTFLKQHLHSYKIPKKIFFISKFEFTPTLKIDKKGTISKFILV
ncbi:MAG: hypothetical protein RLZZ175_398 [Bacteroidota bacterium]|jgi:O-succinylbenzoic acid--CoA ligase